MILDPPTSEEPIEIEWDGEAFKEMKNLEILIIRHACFSQCVNHLPNSLRMLEWWNYPSNSLPSNFHPKELAVFNLPRSRLTSIVFVEKRKFMNLKSVNLNESKIEHVPDLSGAPNLEELSFQGCENLTEVHESIGFLKKLRFLCAEDCSKLRSFPALRLTSLEQLELSGCLTLENFPEILENMVGIDRISWEDTSIKELPSSIANLSNLAGMSMDVSGILRLPNSIATLPYLKYLHILSRGGLQLRKQEEDEGKGSSMVSTSVESLRFQYCDMLDEQIPIFLACFCNVVELYLDGNDFIILPESIKELCSLRELTLNTCQKLREIRGIPPNIERLSVANCLSLTPSCRSMLLNEEYHSSNIGKYRRFHLPGSSIPEWFEQSSTDWISFWFRNNIPSVSLCVVLGSDDGGYSMVWPEVIINGNRHHGHEGIFELIHVADHITIVESKSFLECDKLLSENQWNRVVVLVTLPLPLPHGNRPPMKEFGFRVHKHASNTEDIRFTAPRGDLDPFTYIQECYCHIERQMEEEEEVGEEEDLIYDFSLEYYCHVEREIEEEEEVGEEEAEEEEGGGNDDHKDTTFVPGPLLPLEDQIERHKEDESRRTGKEKPLGCLESDLDGEVDPEVKFHSIGVISKDLGEIVTPLPLNENQNGRVLFSLKEGSRYQLKLKFSVLHNIVSGLRYSNLVWKGGLQVHIDQSKGTLGTFAPQKEPYIHALEEEVTPSGLLARGVYSAKLKLEDDDGRCHMEVRYSFESS